MKNKEKKAHNFQDVKNLARGAISLLRQRAQSPHHKEMWRQEQVAQQQFNRATSIAKKHLNPKEFVEFEEWLANQIKWQTPKSLGIGTDLRLMGLFPSDLTHQGLATEIRVATENIKRHQKMVVDFMCQVREVVNHIRSMSWDKAFELLEVVEKQFGHSFWSIELKLALMQEISGVEKVKSTIADMSQCSYGLMRFFLYYFGVRNEPAQNSARFIHNARKKISESDLSENLKAYAKFRISGELQPNENYLACVFSCEQLTTTIDLAFTTIRLITYILSQEDFFVRDVKNAVNESCVELRKIIDSFDDEILSQSIKHNQLSEKSQKNNRLNNFARMSIISAVHFEDKIENISSLSDLVVAGVSSKLSTRSNGVRSEELSKFIINYSWMPECVEIGGIENIPPLPELLIDFSKFPYLKDVEALSINEALKKEAYRICTSSETISSSFDEIIKTVKMDCNLTAIKEGIDKSDSIGVLSPVACDLIRIALAKLSWAAGLNCDCIALCAKIGVENDCLIPTLPLMEMFSGMKWPSIKSLGDPLSLSIALDHALRVHDERKIRTFKRYAIEELMKVHNCSNVDGLPTKLSEVGVSSDLIEYFVVNVCDQVTIELLPKMESSRKAKETRSKLLRNVASIHTRHEPAYLREAEDIEENLQVDDGIGVLDESKVYVDEASILKSINVELAADFQRYLKLVESGVGKSESIINVIRDFKNPSAKTFQIPKDDANDLLAEMVDSIRDGFLLNPAFGLDIIIGRRIRHGTIANEIRGLLESLELIGQRPRPGMDYEPPKQAVKLCQKIDAKHKKNVSAVFSRFSESIDQLIALLRDDYMHVRSKSKARGIFEINFDPILLSLARAIAQSCNTVDQFSKECIQLFWYILSIRLDVVRPKIETEVKKTLFSIFQKLNNELRSNNVNDPAFFAVLQQASDELQRRASIIASWVRVPQFNIDSRSYSMKYAVDVAIALITGRHPSFQPNVMCDVPDDLELDTHGFAIVEDALFIALENIYQHSGKIFDNNVSIQVDFNSVESIISFSIENDVAQSARSTEKDSRLAATRAVILRRAYTERARLDRGGSGLCKLAAIVMQSEKARIEFDYISPQRFRLRFDLVWINTAASSYQKSSSELEGSTIGMEMLS